MKKLWILFLIISAGFFSAQETYSSPPPPAEADSELSYEERGWYDADSVLAERPITESQIYPKKFKENLLQRYKSDDFKYQEPEEKKSGFWERFARFMNRVLAKIFGKSAGASASGNLGAIAIRLFAIILAGFVLYFIIRFLVGKDGNLFFGKRNKKLIIKAENIDENIHEINFAEAISQSENEHDYRSAIRYQFLLILKKLSDRKKIVWNPEKTNHDYENEISDLTLKQDFAKLLSIFEYVWYGEFAVDAKDYERIKTQFQSFKS
ncbi:hypothetical protein ASG01_07020 [Chryseobacterium sp. Leaf180]|uniref:DUF4129 domain-containing protein n=1 Tax=Chryseobacterium sp. Leaf180 TaxID=1736289 RepID=UPI0006F710A7|nr:DUF4129 domain-containing protein [Chryseobacterium sp. Leaf180]KQR95587.1 hypothetical protein ASG01_07020 [Chryseobacterium sp. Leaf180]